MKTGVILSLLNTFKGDKEIKFKDTEEGRLKLSAKINKLRKEGAACFLTRGSECFKIVGYDPENNEWLIQGSPSKYSGNAVLVEVTVIAPTSGG